ncbi:glycoside hydrolase family 3 C-terminal domain-containing protein [Catellatospora sp. KI3]|uniref:beta-glucosidase family protein n=1 Tax=Catellatospora sp. KI3 TaxID=3041620 RepID=UPI00248324B0|nr:glycoside hydrolase family 3 C-terminal domain-containing protein [Catellatospora sp. KI3]MDI1459813.1 glycoside hydrolase family 3 C-terminal domain-containing protein [Catellatospora sp. KI3]
MNFRDPRLPLPERVADLRRQLTLAERISLLHQHQPPIARLDVGGFRTGTEALHGLAWLGEATVFPQAVGLGASWDPDLVRRVGAAVGDEVRASHHKDPSRAGLNVWAPVVNPLRDPRWGRNEEGYSEDAWLTGLLGQAYAQGLRGDHPTLLKTAPTLKHFLGYNNENDRCTSSSNLGPRVLHEYELPAYRPALAGGAAVAVMASYNLVNGRPAHVTPLINDELRTWTEDEILLVSDAYAPSNLADPDQQAYFPDHATSHAAALRAGVDSFTDADDRSHVTVERITEALERGLLTEADIDRAVDRALTVRMRLGEFDPVGSNPFAQITPETIDESAHRRLAREAARKSMVLLKQECQLLPLNAESTGRVAVIGPLGDQLMTDWYSGTLPYQVTARDGLVARLGPDRVDFVEGADRVALALADGGFLCAGPTAGALTRGEADPHGFDVFDWGSHPGRGGHPGSVLALRAVANGAHVTVRDNVLVNDAPGPNGWEVHETFRLVEHADGTLSLHHELSRSYLAFAADGTAVVGADAEHAARVVPRLLRSGAEQAALVAAEADAVIVVLGNHPLVNGRETEDRENLFLPPAADALLRAVYAANQHTALVLTSSYPYAITWADVHLPAIIWSSHGGQEFGHALADVLFGDEDAAGRLPQTWYRSHCELPDLFDYDIITNDATYLYYRGTPLYPLGHGLSWAEFEYGAVTLHSGDGAADTVEPDAVISVRVEVANVGERPGEEVVQLYTHQQRSRVKQPLRQLRGFARVRLAPGERAVVDIPLRVSELAFWDVTTGRPVVEAARHKVMVGRSATDIRGCATLTVRGERIGPRRPRPVDGGAAALRAVDHDEACGIALVDTSPERGDSISAVHAGGWVSFGPTDLSGRTGVAVGVAGASGRVVLRADDPLDGDVLAEVLAPGSGRYAYTPLACTLAAPAQAGPVDLYLVCDAPGIIVDELLFS